MTISSTIGIVKPYKDGVVPFECHWTNSSLKQNSMQKQLPPDITVNVDGYPPNQTPSCFSKLLQTQLHPFDNEIFKLNLLAEHQMLVALVAKMVVMLHC